jgi:cell division protein FtsI/penicillin-binding protein 2
MLLVRIAALALCVGIALPGVPQSRNAMLRQGVRDAMSGLRGTAVVLEVHSGQVLASYRLDVAARRVAYPGSSIKPFTLMALLERGKLDRQAVLACKRTVTIAGRKLNCSHPRVQQPLDAAAALAYSCNSYFTSVALRLSPAQLRESLVHDGFTSITSLAPREAAGSVALAQSPEQLQLQAIGEWGVKVTPLELVRAYRQLALLAQAHDAKLKPLFDGLRESVSYGMARLAQPEDAEAVAGKTGTARAEEGRWTHAWFAGYAPAENPDIVVVVFLERGHGGTDAADVAHDIFSAYADWQDTRLTAAQRGAR